MSTPSIATPDYNPFPGLRPFHQGEEHYFFGRESQTDTLVDRLRKSRFLAVIGSSGSGKSSLVNCGLLTALQGGLMPEAGTAWKIAQCRPSGRPIHALAEALAQKGLLFSDFDSKALDLQTIVDANLRISEQGIVDVLELSRQPKGINLLIVVDQFEELFRYASASGADTTQMEQMNAEAAEFIKLLLYARKQTTHPIYIVLTMRSDFLGDCTRFEGLAEAINESQYLVPRMSRDERRLAISGPVEVGGATIDPVLLTRLINELGDDPDQLSILQHAFNRIWARWLELDHPDNPLSIDHYSAIGSMKMALNDHAEKIYAELDTERKKVLCEKLFKALTNKSTDRRGVRRPTTLSTLCKLSGAGEAELIKVIDVFRHPSRSFLLPPATHELQADSVIDISHESLMRMWNRLSNWADEEADSTDIFQRLSSTAALHANGQAGLWRDPDLQLALEWRLHNEPNACWASRIGPGFDRAMAFLDDSRAANDVEAAEKLRRAEQDRELERTRAISTEQQKRLHAQSIAVKKQRQVSLLIAGGFVVTSGLSYFAMQQTRAVRDQLDRMARVAPVLASVTQQNQALAAATTDQQQILVTAMSLLEQNRVFSTTKLSSRRFSNTTESSVLVLKINSEGYETEPTLISPGQSASIRGFTNQIWLARTLPSGSLLSTGSLNDTVLSTEF